MRFVFIILLFSLTSASAQEPKLMLPIGHSNSVTSAVFSPDGKKVVTTSVDKTVKIWNSETGMLLADLNEHTEGVNSASFSPDGKRIVTASKDGTAKIWNTETGGLLVSLEGHIRSVGSAFFSSDGNKVVTSSQDHTAKIWNSETGILQLDLQGHKNNVTSAVFSADRKKIITGSWDGTARIWDAETGMLLTELKHPRSKGNSGILAAVFSPDGKKALTVSQDTAKLWNCETGVLLADIHEKRGLISSAFFSPDSKRILTNYSVLDSETGKPLVYFNGHNSIITSATFSVDGDRVATASWDRTAKIWNSKTGELLTDLRGHSEIVNSSIFSPDGRKIITTSSDNTAKIWDSKTGTLLSDLKGQTYRIYSAAPSPDGKRIVIASEDPTVKVWSTTSGALLTELKGHGKKVYLAAYSPIGNKIFTASDDSTAKIWDTGTGTLSANLKGHTAFIVSAVFSPDGKKLVTASQDHTSIVWNSETGAILSKLSGHTDEVYPALFSPDGKKIVTGSADHTVKVWDGETGALLINFKEHKDWINSISFSPDGKKIVSTASRENTAKIWSSENGILLKNLKGHKGEIRSAVFSPDGKKVVTGSADATTKIWNAETGRLLVNFNLHNDIVDHAGFSEDGEKVVSIPVNGSVKILNSETGFLVGEVEVHNSEVQDIDFKHHKLLTVNNAKITYYDLEEGKQLYSFIPVASTDFIIQLPSGHYLATPYTAKLLHYVTPDLKVITFEQLDVKYNRPDMVLQALGNTDTALVKAYRKAYEKRIKKLGIDTTAFGEGFGLPEADFVQRDNFSYEQTNGQLTLHIKGQDSSYQLDRFNLWINEAPLFGIRGISLRNKKTNFIDTTIHITLSAGKNIIETSVTNVNGTESYRMPLHVNYTPREKSTGKTYFIGIGINQFKQKGHDLQWSVKDIKDLADSLKNKLGSTADITTLYDEEVTLENIVALKEKLKKTSVDDKVILSYSGHGLLSKEYDYYLSTYNVNFQSPQDGGLPYELFESLLDSIPARNKLMLIDACHSGEVDKEEMTRYALIEKSLEDSGTRSGRKPVLADGRLGMKSSFELMQELFVNVGRSTGATVISAAAGTQFAQERSSLQNGVFTFSILEFMRLHPTATVSELRSYVNKRVTELTNGLQVPTTRSETKAVDWKVW